MIYGRRVCLECFLTLLVMQSIHALELIEETLFLFFEFHLITFPTHNPGCFLKAFKNNPTLENPNLLPPGKFLHPLLSTTTTHHSISHRAAISCKVEKKKCFLCQSIKHNCAVRNPKVCIQTCKRSETLTIGHNIVWPHLKSTLITSYCLLRHSQSLEKAKEISCFLRIPDRAFSDT